MLARMSTGAWDRFEQDPRSPHTARLRASDRDRDVALDVLAQAFADGRLDREEYDARSAAVSSAKTLGDLVPLLDDLVPVDGATLVPRASAVPAPTDLHEQAVRRWARDRREAVTGLITVSAVCWTIWAVIMYGGFPWPVFPMMAQAVVVLRTVLQKQDIIDKHERKLAQKQAERVKELESGQDPDSDDDA
jgi:uncharacterized membrane protein